MLLNASSFYVFNDNLTSVELGYASSLFHYDFLRCADCTYFILGIYFIARISMKGAILPKPITIRFLLFTARFGAPEFDNKHTRGNEIQAAAVQAMGGHFE